MDNSSVIIDSSHFKLKIGEVIEGSVNIMEKGTASIFKELNKMREEYSGLISKFLDYCEKEGISLDFLEDNSRSTSIERESSTLSLNFAKQPNSNPFKVQKIKSSALELKKFKMDSKIKTSNYAHSSSSTLIPRGSSKETKIDKVKWNKYSKNTQFRSLTPVGPGPKSAVRNNESSSNIQDGSRGLPRIEKIKNESPIFKIDPRMVTDSSSLSYSYLNNKSTLSKHNRPVTTTTTSTTPKSKNQKSDLKTYIMYNQNNNYTKKFMFKQTIETVNGSKNSNTKEKKSLKGNKNEVITDFNKIENKLINDNMKLNSNSKLNISVRNVNINLNNNLNVQEPKKFDDRKLSILDIAGCGPLINIENIIHTNSQNKDEEDLDESFKKSEDKEVSNRLIFNNLKYKFDKFCYSIAASDVVPLKMRLIFSKMSKRVNEDYPPIEILKDHSNLLNENIKIKENYLSSYLANPVDEERILKKFCPSKTAQNSLNFITKEDELMLTKENFHNLPAREEILGILKIVYILIRQNYTKIDDRLLADYLINKILVKLKIENLKSLFQNIICNNLLISNDQMIKITNIVDKHSNILNPSFILKSNKVIAYITFIIKEIYEHLTEKAHDGTLILNLRKHRNNIRKMKEKVAKINKFIIDRKCK